MDNGIYSKVNDISLHLECPKCPVKLKSASILNDSEKNLQLLRVTFSNVGDRSVKAIYLKLVFYDNYENIVPDNGKDYKIWGLSGLQLEPSKSESEPMMLILPGTEVMDCEIYVTKVIYSDGEVLLFSESDYTLPISKIGQRIAILDGKKGKKILLTSIAAVILLYALIAVGVHLIKVVYIPMSEKAYIEKLTENHQYDELLSREQIFCDPIRNDEVATEAIKYYVSEEDFDAAVNVVARIQNEELRSEAAVGLCEVLMDAKRYDLAKELAEQKEYGEMRAEVIHHAIEYYCSINEYGEALEYASVSGDADCKHDICGEAIDFYLLKNDYKTALEYADKVGDTESKETVYEAAIKNSYDAGDYNSSALYIAESGLYPNKTITASYIDKVISKADKNFVRENLELFYPLMSFARKQSLFATTIDVYKDPVGITDQNKVTGFSSKKWTGIVSVKNSEFNTVALKSDGTVLVHGNNDYKQCDVSSWTDITAIASGQKHTAAVRSDGAAVAVGNNEYGQCDVSSWTGIVEIAAGKNHTVGLKADGTVVAAGNNAYGQCNVSEWTNIVAIACGDNHTVGLRHDGTVVAIGHAEYNGCNVSEWTDVVQISAGATHTVGLHSNGTVILTGNTHSLYCGDVSTWCDVTYVSAGSLCTMGLTSTGKILISGDGAPSINAMKNIKQAPST